MDTLAEQRRHHCVLPAWEASPSGSRRRIDTAGYVALVTEGPRRRHTWPSGTGPLRGPGGNDRQFCGGPGDGAATGSLPPRTEAHS